MACYTVLLFIYMFVIWKEVVLNCLEKAPSGKTDVYILLLYANIPTAAGLQGCARFVGRSPSVDTSLLAGHEEALIFWPARLFADVKVFSFAFCVLQ